MIPYENLNQAIKQRTVQYAENIMKFGWQRRGFPPLDLTKPIPWELKSPDQRSWNFHIHCWDMLDSILAVHSETGDAKYLEFCLPIIVDWIKKHEKLEAVKSPFAWDDMAAGIRALRLSYATDAVTAAGLGDKTTHKRLWHAVEMHREYLSDDAHVSFHNNHGFYQVAGQLAMSRRFNGRLPLMAEAHAQATTRLLTMIDNQFMEDGVHREHSPDYHRMVYETLKTMVSAGLVDNETIIARIDRIEQALSWFVTPSRNLVNFGDSDLRAVGASISSVKHRWHTSEMQFIASGGAIGTKPKQNSMLFAQGGYFVVREPAQDVANSFQRSSYLALMGAFHSRTHKHADDLSFVWSDRGSDLLVDAGRYGYIGKTEQGSPLWLDGYWYSDPKRVYIETTRAHNTLEFDGINYKRKGAKPYGSALGRSIHGEHGLYVIEAEVKQFNSIRHVRTLIFRPGYWLIVFDWFHDNLQKPHRARQWFHLAPQLGLLTEKKGYVVSVPDSSEPLRTIPLLPGVTPSRPYLAEDEPQMQGWYSPTDNELIPNYAFCYEIDQAAHGCLATLFSFSSSLTADQTWSNANPSGRNARFRWSDEHGRHTLELARPQEGSLTVNYESPVR